MKLDDAQLRRLRSMPDGLIDGRFELLEEAGVGGMGAVYRARDAATDELVAVKVLAPTASADVERFEREREILAELSHPAIVGYVASGTTEDDEPYLAMDWLDGESLAARLTRGPLPWRDAVTLGLRVAEGLDAAHARGVIHRDLKPSNLYLRGGQADAAVILDFGVARLRTAHRGLTQTGTIVGTAGYMAPEQARGQKDVDERADLFSLGCVLYRAIAGEAPFAGDDVLVILAKLVLEEPKRLGQRAPDVPSSLDAMITRLLAKDAALRPASAREVADLLTRVLTGEPGSSAEAPALTSAERELVAVALAPARTLEHARGPSDADALREIGASHHAQLELLGDGSVLAVVRGAGPAGDLVTRAARCALELRVALGARAAMALATGRALSGERVPTGEAIERAAASARRAEGEIAIDEVTAGLLPPRFEVRGEARGLVLVRERPEAQPVRTLLGRATPCVGRVKELAVLRALLETCIDEPSGQVVVLVGPAGAGKSRLGYELVRELPENSERIEVWTGRADPMSAGSPFRLVASALAGACALKADEPLEARQARIRALVGRSVPAAERARVTVFLAELLGAPFSAQDDVQLRSARRDAQLMGDQLRRAFVDLVLAETSSHPLLLVLEDLHWGDLPSVGLVAAALERHADRPLMVLASMRPKGEEMFPDLWAEHAPERLALRPLSRRACERLAEEVLGDDTRPEALARITARAQGNAFFLEELIRAEAEGRGAEVPATLVAMAQARLAALEPEARRILRAASVSGLVFWRACLLELLGGEARPGDVDEWLRTLASHELIMRSSDGRFAGEQEYLFRHDVVREAAHEMLTADDRKLGHRLTGEWLERVGERDAVALAGHFEEGGALESAARWWERAAVEALEGNDFEGALGRVERGVACGAAGEALGRLRLVESEARRWRLELAPAHVAAREATRLLPAGSAPWWSAAARVTNLAANLGDLPGAKDVAGELLAQAGSAQPSPEAAAALALAAAILVVLGEDEIACALEQAASDIRDALPHPDPVAEAWRHRLRGNEAALGGDPASAATASDAASRSFEAAGDVRRSLSESVNLADALKELGQYAEAERVLRDAIAGSDGLGLRSTMAAARHNLGLVLARLGQLDEARALEARAVDDYRAGGEQRMEAASRTYLAAILLAAGELEPAESEARQAASSAARCAPPMRARALAILSAVQHARRDLAAALQTARDAAIAMREHGTDEGESLVRLALAIALQGTGDTAAARAAITEAREMLLARAKKITEPAMRASFLENIPENARTLALAAAWLEGASEDG